MAYPYCICTYPAHVFYGYGFLGLHAQLWQTLNPWPSGITLLEKLWVPAALFLFLKWITLSLLKFADSPITYQLRLFSLMLDYLLDWRHLLEMQHLLWLEFVFIFRCSGSSVSETGSLVSVWENQTCSLGDPGLAGSCCGLNSVNLALQNLRGPRVHSKCSVIEV